MFRQWPTGTHLISTQKLIHEWFMAAAFTLLQSGSAHCCMNGQVQCRTSIREWCSATEPSKVRKPVEAGVLTIAKWKKSVAKDYHFCAAVAGISRIGKLTETESRRRLPRGRGGVAGSGEWLTWCTVSFCAFGAL